MDFMKNLWKNLKKIEVGHIGIVGIVGFIVICYMIYNYSNYSSMGPEQMSGSRKIQNAHSQLNEQQSGSVEPSQPLGQNETYASANGMSTSTQGLPPSCSKSPVADPSELLPKDTNSQWAQLNPSGSGDLQNVNLLRSGYHMGIDTVGNTLRNANLQLRSEPANPQLNVGPWNNTTISPDTMRTPLELGQGAQ